ncbi:MAG: hypothetical protein K9M15_00140 [Candidatus Marinimicrobia bacterium]|nr:hypothetical protein [Candidatus Neomarinimicrobiota bacterium]
MFDRGRIVFGSLFNREHKIFASSVKQLDSEIDEYKNPGLDALVEKITEARKKNRPVIWMMGAHVIRRGNSMFIIDLMKRGIITHVATNGAGAIHDFELSCYGATCEDVERYIKHGQFGNWEETGRFINEAVKSGYDDGLGYGGAVGKAISDHVPWFKHLSIFMNAYELGVPITVHKGIGCDITDQHPSADYEVLGGASGRDFLTFADSVSKLEGGVFLNLGTQVMGPEIYLKALSMARNVASRHFRMISNFTTAVFDIVDLGDNHPGEAGWKKEDDLQTPSYYFRPKKTILIRTVKDGGQSYYIKGDFAVTVPNLYKKIIERI